MSYCMNFYLNWHRNCAWSNLEVCFLLSKYHSQFDIVLYKILGSMITFKIWAADCTVLAVQAVAALLSQVKIVRLSYILKSSNLSALMRSPL